jgi:hypothetical protein
VPWFKVDDKFHDHRKARRAKKAAIGVWVLAGSWCMDNLTDGFVPESVLNRWGSRRDATQLCQANLWETAEKDGEKGWQFLNWTEFQPSKAEVESEREATKERVKKWREGKKGNAVSNAVTDAATNGDVTPEVRAPRPDPTRPDPSKELGARKRAAHHLPDDFAPTEDHTAIAAGLGVDLEREFEKFCDYWRAEGKPKADWNATLRNWLRRAGEDRRGGTRPAPVGGPFPTNGTEAEKDAWVKAQPLPADGAYYGGSRR